MALSKIQTAQMLDTPNLGRRNLIINGAMRVAQRGTQTTSVASSGYFATDRMKYYDAAGIVATVEQVSDAPSGSGFQYSHKVTATTADTSIGATELGCPLWYIIEKQDVDARLAYGTSSAKPLTMSFWIKSNVTGTYTISAYRSATPARVQAQTYTISAANTWEFKTLTWVGDTTEAIDVDLHFYFNGFVGGDYSNTSTTSGWATYNTGNWAGGHTATWGDSTNDTWQITGLQLEVGDSASDFEHRSFAEELRLCMRYYEKSYNYGVVPGSAGNSAAVNYQGAIFFTTAHNNHHQEIQYKERKRAAPTLTLYNTHTGATGQNYSHHDNNSTAQSDTWGNGENGARVSFAGTGDGERTEFHYTAESEI